MVCSAIMVYTHGVEESVMTMRRLTCCERALVRRFMGGESMQSICSEFVLDLWVVEDVIRQATQPHECKVVWRRGGPRECVYCGRMSDE